MELEKWEWNIIIETEKTTKRLKKWRKHIGMFKKRRDLPYLYYVILKVLAKNDGLPNIDSIIHAWLNGIEGYGELSDWRKQIIRERYSNTFYHRIWELIRKGYVANTDLIVRKRGYKIHRKGYKVTLKGLIVLALVDNNEDMRKRVTLALLDYISERDPTGKKTIEAIKDVIEEVGDLDSIQEEELTPILKEKLMDKLYRGELSE